jgi:hypothetical protein
VTVYAIDKRCGQVTMVTYRRRWYRIPRYARVCVRPKGHDGPHRDRWGVAWMNYTRKGGVA